MAQKTCYVMPTSLKHEHHSQVSFDPLQSLVVKPLGQRKVSTGLYKDCWAQEFSAPRLAKKSAKPVLVRESTEHPPCDPWARSTKECLTVSTATLPKTGLIKLISTEATGSEYYDSHHISNSPFRANRPKRSNTSVEKRPAFTRNKTYHFGQVNDLTVDDLRLAINNKYPGTNGIAFSRATTFMKEAAPKESADSQQPVNAPVSQEKLVQSYLRATEPRAFDPVPSGFPKPLQELRSPPNTPLSTVRGSFQQQPDSVTIGIPEQGDLLDGSLPERNYSHSIDSM